MLECSWVLRPMVSCWAKLWSASATMWCPGQCQLPATQIFSKLTFLNYLEHVKTFCVCARVSRDWATKVISLLVVSRGGNEISQNARRLHLPPHHPRVHGPGRGPQRGGRHRLRLHLRGDLPWRELPAAAHGPRWAAWHVTRDTSSCDKFFRCSVHGQLGSWHQRLPVLHLHREDSGRSQLIPWIQIPCPGEYFYE